jgi:hypothetical protein
MQGLSFQELKKRLEDVKSGHTFDDRYACCWRGYLAALIEWGLISPNTHLELIKLIPIEEPDPSDSIFLG